MTRQQRLSLLAGAAQRNDPLNADRRGSFVRGVSRNEP